MAIYVVAYDLNKEIHRPNITAEIKKYEWRLLYESSYAIKTNETPTQVYNKLKPLIDANDNIYVISLRKPYMGFGPKDTNEWLDKNLPQQ